MKATLLGGFPSGRGCDAGPYAPTGESFIVLSGGGYTSASTAEAGARSAFNKYAADHEGDLYWRVMPSIEHRQGNYWGFYMRLLISNKEVNHA
jgi:hypothetical protein